MSIGDAEIKTQERVIRFLKIRRSWATSILVTCQIIRIRTLRKIVCASTFD